MPHRSVLILLLSFLFLSFRLSAEPVYFKLAVAREGWQKTGINVKYGDAVVVTALGSAVLGKGAFTQKVEATRNSWIKTPVQCEPKRTVAYTLFSKEVVTYERGKVCAADGTYEIADNTFLAPGLTRHSLIGRWGIDGRPFHIGLYNRITFTNASDERAFDLYLAMNDSDYTDNQGEWSVLLRGTTYGDPDGDPTKTGELAPGLAYDSLVGKIGVHGDPIPIGGKGMFIAKAGGELWLGINESDNGWSDNEGTWDIQVQVHSKRIKPYAKQVYEGFDSAYPGIPIGWSVTVTDIDDEETSYAITCQWNLYDCYPAAVASACFGIDDKKIGDSKFYQGNPGQKPGVNGECRISVPKDKLGPGSKIYVFFDWAEHTDNYIKYHDQEADLGGGAHLRPVAYSEDIFNGIFEGVENVINKMNVIKMK